MKKIPILLSILTASLGNIAFLAHSSSAMYQENDTTWWTVEELLEFSHQIDAEREELCHGNQDCEMEYNYTMYEKGDKYRALDNLLQTQFWITSVNPENETIKVLFFDEDMMLRHMGIKEYLEIEHLYLGWFENGHESNIFNYNHDSFTNGSMPDSHPLYDSTIEDLSLITPWKEVELSVAGGNLIDNSMGKIAYAIFAKNNLFNAQGVYDYSSCLKANDYTKGSECKLMMSGDEWATFLPPRETIIEPEPESTTEPNPETPSDSEPELEPNANPESKPEEPVSVTDPGVEFIDDTEPKQDDIYSEPESSTVSTESIPESNTTTIGEPVNNPMPSINPSPESWAMVLTGNDNHSDLNHNLTSTATLNSDSTPKSPNTGKSTSLNNNANEFPWWLPLILILNGIILMRFFRLKPQKTSQNYQKSKKGLDKRV